MAGSGLDELKHAAEASLRPEAVSPPAFQRNTSA